LDRRTAVRALTIGVGATLLLAAEAADDVPAAAVSGRTAIFFSPHPDDEVLQQLVEIIRHVDDGWHVVVVDGSNGDATVAIHYINGDSFCDYHGYWHRPPKLLTPRDIGLARITEQRSTCQIAGVHEYVAGVVPDEALTVAGWRKIILDNVGRLRDGDRIFVPTPWETTSGLGDPQHGNAGIALQQLLAERNRLPAVDVFYTVWSHYWDHPGCPVGVTRGFVNPIQEARAISAAQVYQAFNPAAGSYGVGWCHSVNADFQAGFADKANARYLQQRFHV
jgi:hypothetical protein